jgi:hypothetical protein
VSAPPLTALAASQIKKYKQGLKSENEIFLLSIMPLTSDAFVHLFRKCRDYYF